MAKTDEDRIDVLLDGKHKTLPRSEYAAAKRDLGDRLRPAPSQGMAALEGASQGVSFGFSDELSGLLGATFGEEGMTTDPDTGKPRGRTWKERYRAARDMAREDYGAAREVHPKTTFAGEVTGGALVPVGGTLGTARKLKAAPSMIKEGLRQGARAAPAGAALGATVGAGKAAEMSDVPLAAAGGATVGGAAGFLGGAVSGAASGRMAAQAKDEAIRRARQVREMAPAQQSALTRKQELIGKVADKRGKDIGYEQAHTGPVLYGPKGEPVGKAAERMKELDKLSWVNRDMSRRQDIGAQLEKMRVDDEYLDSIRILAELGDEHSAGLLKRMFGTALGEEAVYQAGRAATGSHLGGKGAGIIYRKTMKK